MCAWRLWLAAFVAMWTSSCFEAMRWESQDIHLKYDAESDTARVLLVYEGVFAGEPKGANFKIAVNAVKAIAAKKRYFALIDWPLEFDLDACVRGDEGNHALAKAAKDDPTSPEAKFWEWLRGIEVVDAHVVLGTDSRLSIVQELKMPRFTLLAEAGNLAIARKVGRDGDSGSDFSAAEAAAWRAKAATKEPWLYLERDSIEFRAPYGPRWIASVVTHLASDDGPGGAGVAGALSELIVENDEAVFRWSADESNTLHFHFGPPDGEPREYDDALRARLEADGMKFQSERIENYVERFQR